MFKNIRAILYLIIFLLGGCDSYLDLKPVDTIVNKDFWKTKEQVQSAVIGIYASMLSDDFAERLFLYGELRADMLMQNAGIRATESEVMNGNILETNAIADWRPFYRSINNCNTVLELAPQVLQEDLTFTHEQLNAYLAEALTLRSLLYFYLVRSFGDVPLKLKATLNDDDEIALPKSSQQDIMVQIIDDLKLAEQWAVVSYGNNAYNKGRITRYTVNAIQADIYLWNEEYENSITACNKIINSGQFGLVAGVNNPMWFEELYAQGNSSESIFELQFSAQKINPFFPMFHASTGRRFLASPRVIEEVFTMDMGNPLNVDLRMNASIRTSNSTLWKYLGLTADQGRSQNESYANWIFYRYADILLMKAEAMANEGGGEEVIDLINLVRDRANALPGTKREVAPHDVTELIDYILEERAREFAFEGKRWFDVLRNAKRNNYERINILINMVINSAPADRQQTIVNKYRDVNSHYWPIHLDELQRNKNLEQNPFYQ